MTNLVSVDHGSKYKHIGDAGEALLQPLRFRGVLGEGHDGRDFVSAGIELLNNGVRITGAFILDDDEWTYVDELVAMNLFITYHPLPRTALIEIIGDTQVAADEAATPLATTAAATDEPALAQRTLSGSDLGQL